MNLGWPGLIKTVVLSVTLTSTAWIAVGVWWYETGVASNSAPATKFTRCTNADVVVVAAAPAMEPRSDIAPSVVQLAQRLIIPVEGVRPEQLSDTFTEARAGSRRHDAIDIMAPRGTPVIAAAAGRLEKMFLSKAGGRTVYVRSPDDRTIYYYAHLDEYAPGLAEGQSLQQGAAIGKVGFSGNASPAAPHLHFAIMATTPERKWWDAAAALNPYPLLK